MTPQKPSLAFLFFGGLLPVVAFALIEDSYGPLWGTVAALIFGAGEIAFEKWKTGMVSSLTLWSNVFVFTLGVVAILTQEGVWFKLQPALMMSIFSGLLLFSSWRKKPLLVELSLKQNPQLPEGAILFLGSINSRLGIWCLFLAGLSAWAAISWSTPQWAALKAFGLPLFFGAYFIAEIAYLKLRSQK